MRNLGLRCENLIGVASPPNHGASLRCELGKAHKHRRQILSWKSDPPTPFLCIPGWESSFTDETEGTHKMWFKVAIGSVSVTSPCPLRPSQAGFLIRAVGRSWTGLHWQQLLLQGQGRPYLMYPGPLTLDPQSLSSTDLMGQNIFQIETIFFLIESLSIFSQRRPILSDPQLCSFIHSIC